MEGLVRGERGFRTSWPGIVRTRCGGVGGGKL